MAEVVVIYQLYLLRTSAFKPSFLRLVLNQKELQKTSIKATNLAHHTLVPPTNPNTFVLLHIDVTKPWPPKLHPSGIHMAGRHSIFQVPSLNWGWINPWGNLRPDRFHDRNFQLLSTDLHLKSLILWHLRAADRYSRHVWAAPTASAGGCGYHRSLRSLKLL